MQTTPLLKIPPFAVLAHYTTLGGVFGVYTPAGRFLAASFYELRHQFTYGGQIYGSGQWVVLLPIRHQPPLF